MPFSLADNAPALAADAPGSAAVRLGSVPTGRDRRSSRGSTCCSASRSTVVRMNRLPSEPPTPEPTFPRPLRGPYAGASAPARLSLDAGDRHGVAAGDRAGRVGRPRMITIPIEDWVFAVAALVGGVLLLITVVFDDILGGLLDGFGFDIGGTTLTPILLGFIGMFGAGGLFATQVLDIHGAQAAIVGVLSGDRRRGARRRPVQRAQPERERGAVQARGPRRRRGVRERRRSPPAGTARVLAKSEGQTHEFAATADRGHRGRPDGAASTGAAGNGLIVQDETRGRRDARARRSARCSTGCSTSWAAACSPSSSRSSSSSCCSPTRPAG